MMYCPNEECKYQAPPKQWKEEVYDCPRCGGGTTWICPQCKTDYDETDYDLEDTPDWYEEEEEE